ncbi:hypothetical protein Anapl_14453 [Anas platyrhynchos]|uniref:Uncharacterized protein n=1 Tax=Anas platyrhynchos TaxID=8839 RepID=R0LJA2_ANAPL|nr:hypothetical protein Anapl_14453 [Anas platyrhynchos]
MRMEEMDAAKDHFGVRIHAHGFLTRTILHKGKQKIIPFFISDIRQEFLLTRLSRLMFGNSKGRQKKLLFLWIRNSEKRLPLQQKAGSDERCLEPEHRCPQKAFAKAEVGRTRRKQILKPQMLPLCKGLIAAQVRMQSHP